MEQFFFLSLRELSPTRYEISFVDGTVYQTHKTREAALEAIAKFHSAQCEQLSNHLRELQNQVKDAGLWWSLGKVAK